MLTAATPDIVSPAAWSDFECRFREVGDVYVGSTRSPPCPGGGCTWRFVRVTNKLAVEPWSTFVLRALQTVWANLNAKRYRWFVYARADMQWLVEPALLLLHVRSNMQKREPGSTITPLVYVPDSENYWGANDRFAICNQAASAPYFTRASLLEEHSGNSEQLLAAALKRVNASILLVPTLGALSCCSSAALLSCNSPVCARVWVNSTGARGRVLDVKYVFEAQAAIQNAEVLLRSRSKLVSDTCPASAQPTCVRPRHPSSPHACLPMQALCLRPEQPQIAWRALWHRNRSDWYRWLSPPPWDVDRISQAQALLYTRKRGLT